MPNPVGSNNQVGVVLDNPNNAYGVPDSESPRLHSEDHTLGDGWGGSVNAVVTTMRVKNSPWIDVTHPDFGGIDLTGVASCSSAIAAALAYGQTLRDGLREPPRYIMPPGKYNFATTVTIDDTLTPKFLTIGGFGEPHSVQIIPPADGVTPAFSITHFSGMFTLEGVSCLYGRLAVVKSSAYVVFRDVYAAALYQGVAPVQVFNTFWFWWTGARSAIQSDGTNGLGHGRTPALELIGDSINYTAPNATSSYLIKLEDIILYGGGVRLIQSGASPSGGAQYALDRVSAEGFVDGALLSVEEGRAYYDAVLTVGSTTVTITDTTGGGFDVTDVGTLIMHPLLPLGTTIAARVSATQVTLSAAPINSCPMATITVYRLYGIAATLAVTLSECGIYDSTGDSVMLRTMLGPSHGVIASFHDVLQSNIARMAHNYSSQYAGQGYIYGTFIGSYSTPLIQDAVGVASTHGYSVGIASTGIKVNDTFRSAGAGSPIGAVTGSPGDRWTQKDGNGETWYKQTGAASNTGWFRPVEAPQRVEVVAGTTYTLDIADQGAYLATSNAGAITLTVPTQTSVPFPIGAIIKISANGAGQVTVAPAGGVTIQSAAGLKTRAQFSTIFLQYLGGPNFWLLYGDSVV